MTTFYKAVFSDGTVLKRSTKNRIYSHAWLIKGRYVNTPPDWQWSHTWQDQGFNRSEHIARATLARYSRAGRENVETDLQEVAPAVEITRQEYKAL